MVQQSSKRPREDITPEPSAKKLNDQSGSVLEEPVETTSDRATQKLLRLQRKASKTPLFELIQELKKLWEQIRMKNLPKQSRKQVVSSTVQMVKGSIHDLIFKHDASRIVQSLIKYSDADTDRRDILKELQGHYVEMSQSAYGRFAVLKALKYAPNAALRSQIIQEFVESKSAIKLIRKKMSAIIVDTVYCLYANGKERQLIIEEFYGAEYALTKSCITSNSNGKRWDLTEILQAYPDRKQRILSQMQDILRGIIGKEGTIGPNEIIHRALYDLLVHQSLAEIQELTMKETSPLRPLLSQLPTFVHTKFGSQIAMTILAAASAKERKAIMKALKPYVRKIARDSFGWMVLARAFDCVDDTVLMKSCVVSELLLPKEGTSDGIDDGDDGTHLLANKNIAQLLLYLLAGQTTKYFSPDLLRTINVRSELIQSTSKKDPAVRAKENRSTLIPALKQYLLQGDVIRSLFTNWQSGLVLCELLKNSGDSNEDDVNAQLLAAITHILADPSIVYQPPQVSVVQKINIDDSEDSADEGNDAAGDRKASAMKVNKLYASTDIQSAVANMSAASVTHVLFEKTAPRIIKRLIIETQVLSPALFEAFSGGEFVDCLLDDYSRNSANYPAEPFQALCNLAAIARDSKIPAAKELLSVIQSKVAKISGDNSGLQRLLKLC